MTTIPVFLSIFIDSGEEKDEKAPVGELKFIN